MQYKLKVIEKKGEDFNKIKKDGFNGVIFSSKFSDKQDVNMAKNNRLKIFFHLSDFCRKPCIYLGEGGVYEGELYAVTPESIKSKKQKIKEIWDLIDAIIIPPPHIKGLLWNENCPKRYEDFCSGDIEEDFELIFDSDLELADIRMWYYDNASKDLFYSHVIPVCECVSGLGKEFCFDLGSMTKGIDFVKRLLNPFLFAKEKISVIYENNGGVTFCGGRKRSKDILLVMPMRLALMGYAWQMHISRRETPLTLALAEEEYYKEMLRNCGFDYEIVGETGFFEMSTSKLKRFSHIIICDACMLSERDKAKVERLKQSGCKINDKEILNILDRVN